MAQRRKYRLPRGEYTYRADTYADAWVNLIQPLLVALGEGWSLHACDPGYRLSKTVQQADGRWREVDSLNISVPCAEQLMKALAANGG